MEQEKINGRIRLIAAPGKRITKGDGVYPVVVDLAVGLTEEGYYEIDEEEYQRILQEEKIKMDSEGQV